MPPTAATSNHMNSIYNVRDYNSRGVAVPTDRLQLTHFNYIWLEYPQDTQATIYKAKPGSIYDSVGIQAAIDAAHANGGGTVLIPSGNYLIGPIELKSDVELHLEAGAHLWGSPDISDYTLPKDKVLPKYSLANGYNRASEGLDRDLRRLISADSANNISITGSGQISAQSPAFIIPWLNSKPKDLLSLLRPQDSFIFYKCNNVLVEGIRVLDTPAWSMVFDTCDSVNISGIKLDCFKIINSDGIDLVNSSRVTISNCQLNCTDDAICLKNTVPGATMGHITVTNCILSTLCNGFKIGTDSIGNFENVTLNNLVIQLPDTEIIRGDRGGINLNALDGGTVKNINISNVVMRNVYCPFYLYATARTGPQEALGLEKRPGRMKNISITNVIAEGSKYPCYAVGHPDQPIEHLYISNVNCIKTLNFHTEMPPPVLEMPDSYPTPFTFGSRESGDQLPANGLYLRNVESATIRDFKLTALKYDCREIYFEESCRDTDVTGLKLQVPMVEQNHDLKASASMKTR